MILPAIYYGKEGNDKFRLGLGLGFSKAKIQETADFNNGNIDADPYRAYLLSNLSAGNNLESLGLYALIKGDV